VLPAFVLILAPALIAAKRTWYASCAALGLLVIFILATGFAMWRGRKSDCNCFGQLHSAPLGLSTVIRHASLAAFALTLVTAGPIHSGPELWTWLGSLPGNQRKSATVGGCLILVCFLLIVDRSRPESSDAESVRLARNLLRHNPRNLRPADYRRPWASVCQPERRRPNSNYRR
jgi:hypothetical protein